MKASPIFTLLGKTGIAEECLGASSGYKDIFTRVNIEMTNRRPRREQVGQNKLLRRKQLLSWKCDSIQKSKCYRQNQRARGQRTGDLRHSLKWAFEVQVLSSWSPACWRAVFPSPYYPRQKSWLDIYFWYLDLPKPESAPHCQECNIKTGTLWTLLVYKWFLLHATQSVCSYRNEAKMKESIKSPTFSYLCFQIYPGSQS